MAQVRWTVGAREDLREVVEFISRDSAAYAEATADRIVGAVERLHHHPRLGRIVPEYRDGHLRELIVGSYRVVYWVSGADVLYVSFERPQGATDSELDEDGVLMRYRGNQLVGVTILNARKRIADAP